MAMFTSQLYDMRPADSFTDMERDWSDPGWADAGGWGAHEGDGCPGDGGAQEAEAHAAVG